MKQFAPDLTIAPTHWQFTVGKDIVSYIRSETTKKLRMNSPLSIPTPPVPTASVPTPPANQNIQQPMQASGWIPDIYVGPIRGVDEIGIVVRRGSPDGALGYPYSAVTLQRHDVTLEGQTMKVEVLCVDKLAMLLKER